MLSRIARIAFMVMLGLLAWRLLAKPETRRRFRGHIETIAIALLISSGLLMIWHYGFGGVG